MISRGKQILRLALQERNKTHKLQPLDRTVYGPLKKYFNAQNNIMSW